MNSYQNNGCGGSSCSNGYNQNNRGGDCNNAACYVRGGCSSCNRSRCVCGICPLKAAALFAILLAFALGLIFGTVYAGTFFPALAAIIVFAVIMAVAVIALLIYRGCEC